MQGGLPLLPTSTKELMELKWLQDWKLLVTHCVDEVNKPGSTIRLRPQLLRTPPFPSFANLVMPGGLFMCECSQRIWNHRTKVRNRQSALRGVEIFSHLKAAPSCSDFQSALPHHGLEDQLGPETSVQVLETTARTKNLWETHRRLP